MGFEKTTIDDIVAKTRISKRTFYARFASKHELFIAVVRKLTEFHLKPITLIQYRQASLEEQLISIAAELYEIAFHPEVIALSRMLVAESTKFPELSQAMDDPGAKLTISAIQGVFSDARIRGEIADETSFLTDQFINAMIAGPLLRVVFGTEPRRTGDELLDHLTRAVRLFLLGCTIPTVS